jgi:hypothetical protein
MTTPTDTADTGARPHRGGWARWFGWAAWILLALSILDWVLLRRGSAPNPPSWLGVLVGVTVLVFVVRAVAVLVGALRRTRPPLASAGELLTVAGIVTALIAGSANWLLGLQGYVILHEREIARLRHGVDLQLFDAGPLASLDEMNLRIGLDAVELVATGDGGFYPKSIVQIDRDGARSRIEIDPHTAGSTGSLRFYQGAFGFAPRIAILRGEDLLFDRVVPFVSRLHRGGGITFTESFDVEAHDLRVEGAIDFDSLDEGFRGHASLRLSLYLDGEPLGRGTLLPGHFADLDEGFRVGFVDLKRWSEIDVSRRNYAEPVLGGGLAAVLGLLIWPLAAWRRR